MLKKPFLVIAIGAVIGGAGLVYGLNQSGGKNPIGSLVSKSGVELPIKLARDIDATKGASTRGMDILRELDDTFATISAAASAGVVSISSPAGGSGSGFVYRSDGWIITNDHVVGGAKEVDVALPDGRTVKGKVTLAEDDQIDLAVVKVDVDNLSALPLADSRNVRVGEFAIAVGSPFGLDDTVTVGHVSALGRGSVVADPRLGGSRGYSGLIQTDAPINPGNSGGPLLDIDGEVIGVNSTIVSTTQASAGIGFSIPSNVVRAVADELIAKGQFDRGVLGAYIRELTPFEKSDLKVNGGAYVEGVEETGPTAQAGLQKNDVITSFNGKVLDNELELRVALYKSAPGDQVNIDYVRDGQKKSASLKLEAPVRQQLTRQMPETGNPFGEFQRENPNMDVPVRLGVGLRLADATVRSQFKLPADVKGTVVYQVVTGSFADKVGVKVGDVLVELNGEPIKDVSAVGKILESVSWGDTVTIVVNRYEGGSTTRLTLTDRIG